MAADPNPTRSSKYRTAPADTAEMPKGVPYIVSNEAAERFSYYGMRTILVVFMTTHLLGSDGALDPMTEDDATGWYHLFSSAVYFFPLLGAILSDALLGKYRTILCLSMVYCLGHFALALDESRVGLAAGLTLIAIGSGGIKPCVSAHVGDQFGRSNQNLLARVFSFFYFSINLGAFVSQLLTPWLLLHYGSSVAFGVPGILMALATLAFWMGRNKFVHIPAAGMGFVREVFSKEGLGSLLRLFPVYAFVAMFWALFDQTGSKWVFQAQKLDLNFLGIEWLPSQMQAMNPLLVMLLIPLFTYIVYPAIDRIFPLTPLRKISIGFFVTVPAFIVPAWIEMQISAGATPSVGWQLLAYIILTTAEIFVSITCLEFSYTQAPNRMKSLVMSLFLMSISLGNLFTSGVNFFVQNPDGSSKLEGADYYLFFAAAMFATAVGFVFYAKRFNEKRYIQHAEAEAA